MKNTIIINGDLYVQGGLYKEKLEWNRVEIYTRYFEGTKIPQGDCTINASTIDVLRDTKIIVNGEVFAEWLS
nr:MAG TPA: hypothetical protein [Caudoviricetes sp.]